MGVLGGGGGGGKPIGREEGERGGETGGVDALAAVVPTSTVSVVVSVFAVAVFWEAGRTESLSLSSPLL